MHMAMVMGAGILLLVVYLMFGWLWGASAAGMALTHAGFTVRQEMPMLLAVFAVPAAVAAWQLARA
jgi:heme/copper-type cytochrome/quinol oxidase subunit 2